MDQSFNQNNAGNSGGNTSMSFNANNVPNNGVGGSDMSSKLTEKKCS